MKRRARPPILGIAFLLAVACSDSMPTQPQGTPEWLQALIARIEAEPVTTPPSAIYSYRYRGDTVYFRISRCCDIRSVLYDANGAILCEPDGGIDGGGDGRCPDFFSTRSEERLVWQDPRT